MKKIIMSLAVWPALALSSLGQSAEIAIKKDCIIPAIKTFPTPVGPVDENPPFLHFHEPYERSRKNVGQRFYSFRLSQDASFKKNVISSGARRWSFYNPYKSLKKGTWYWQYSIQENQHAPVVWSKNYTFSIDGDERPVTPPTHEELLGSLVATDGPYVIGTADQVGKLLPSSGPLKADFEEFLKEGEKAKIPATFVFPESEVPEKLKADLIKRGLEKQIFTYRMKRGSKLYRSFCNKQVKPAIRRYFLSGSEKDKENAKILYEAAVAAYKELCDAKMGGGFVIVRFRETTALFYDVMRDELEPAQREEVRQLILEGAEEAFLSMLDRLEHINHKSHDWQMEYQKGLYQSIILAKEEPKVREWLYYFYDLFLFRAPTGSRSDGGWFPGHGYVGANEDTLATVPFVLGQITGYDFYQHPWYQNVSRHFALNGPAGLPAGAYGDKADQATSSLSDISLLLSFADEENLWNHWRAHTLIKEGAIDLTASYILDSSTAWYLLAAMQQAGRYDVKDWPDEVPPPVSAARFEDVGLVASHTDLCHIDENISVTFRSCPYGQTAHAHAAQNAFNLTAGREKLFYKTGYYTSHADAHSVQSYKHSRAQNTILPAGFGQDMAVTGYGVMMRFVDSERLTYALGDASNAYNGNYSSTYLTAMRQGALGEVDTSGFGDPDVTRFRRHLLFLKPNHLVIYDELKAEKPIDWTFRLNSPFEIRETPEGGLRTENSTHAGVATLYCEFPTETEVTDQFVGPAFDWQGKLHKIGGGGDQWHSSITTKQKAKATYFLTVIDISKKQHSVKHAASSIDNNGFLTVEAGDYRITAQMDSQHPSLLYAQSNDGGSMLSTGQASGRIKVQDGFREANVKGSTLLFEEGQFSEYVDEVPDWLKYGNLY